MVWPPPPCDRLHPKPNPSLSLSSLIGVQIGVTQKRSNVVMQSASIGWHSQFKSAEEKAQVTCGDAFALVTARVCRCSRQQ